MLKRFWKQVLFASIATYIVSQIVSVLFTNLVFWYEQRYNILYGEQPFSTVVIVIGIICSLLTFSVGPLLVLWFAEKAQKNQQKDAGN